MNFPIIIAKNEPRTFMPQEEKRDYAVSTRERMRDVNVEINGRGKPLKGILFHT